MTEIASTTKTPPMNTSSTSCLMSTATTAMAAPSPSAPTSPMKISAGCALYQRKPTMAPVIDPQNTVSSDVCGLRASCRYSASCACPPAYVSAGSARAAIIIRPMASPSSPSVRFTALDENTTTSATKMQNGATPSAYVHGFLISDSSSSDGVYCLKNGTFMAVE